MLIEREAFHPSETKKPGGRLPTERKHLRVSLTAECVVVCVCVHRRVCVDLDLAVVVVVVMEDECGFPGVFGCIFGKSW